MAVKAIPDGYHSVTPYLVVQGAAQALEFYARAFGAKEAFRMPMPDGKIGHAEMRIGDSVFMLADEVPGQFLSPKSIGGTGVSIMLYIDDVDAAFRQALEAGAKQVQAVNTKFYGDRSGVLQDPFGHVWTIATHVEDLTPEETKRRAREQAKYQQQ